MLQDNISDIEFTKPIQKKQPERVSKLSTKDHAADKTFRGMEDDMNILFKASKVIRVELLKHPKWQFNGSLKN